LGFDSTVQSKVLCELIDVNEMLHSSRVMAALDDVLLIASLAEGRNITWTEWEITYENTSSSHHFRRNFSRPREEETDIDETLVALRDIEGFLNQAVTALRAFDHGDALRQAIQFAISGQGRLIAHSYIILFAGVETLLNVFRSQQNLETIITKKKMR